MSSLFSIWPVTTLRRRCAGVFAANQARTSPWKARSLSLKERSMAGSAGNDQMEMPPPQISVWPLM